jgi:hypothetical protein
MPEMRIGGDGDDCTGGGLISSVAGRYPLIGNERGPELFIPCSPTAIHSTQVDTTGYAPSAVIFVFNPPPEPIDIPLSELFHPWHCEECGRYHFEYFPVEGCEKCKGQNIARRLRGE